MGYLLGFLTIVIHASNNDTARYRDLIPRAQDTWLHGVQHVVAHGGTGPGKLTKPSAPFFPPPPPPPPSSSSSSSPNASSSNSTSPSSHAQASPLPPSRHHHRPFSAAKEGSGVFVSSPDNPGCAIYPHGNYELKPGCESAFQTPSILEQYVGSLATKQRTN